MQRKEKPSSELKNRLLYGALVGAILGLIIGTMPDREPAFGLVSMGVSSLIIAMLAAVSDSFWESLRAAWELVRIAFWRW
jgi:uncharacterized membrane protein YgaE (UPF0421/DUF939 family)